RRTSDSIFPGSDNPGESRPDMVALLLRAAGVRAAAAVASMKVPAADCEDVGQEIALELWLALPNYDASRASVMTFLERIARWRLSAVLRRHRERVRVEPLAAQTCATADGIPAVELHLDYERILASLDTEDREIAILLVEHGPTEISRMLVIARSTVYRC